LGNAETGDETNSYFDFLLVGLIVCVCALLLWSFFGAKPQNYSMIYFSQPSLPSNAKTGEQLSFGFFVENHEGKTITYSYSVSAEGGDKTTKNLELKDGEKKLVEEKIVLSKPSIEKQKVSVKLSKPESKDSYLIFFWLNVSQ